MNDPAGSIWRKWDLHFHTPKSHDHGNKGMSAVDVVDRLVKANVSAVVVTDHHVLDAEFVTAMQVAGRGKLTVLPGIELTSELGGSDGVHFIGIFPETANIAYVSGELMSKLNLATQRAKGVAEHALFVEFKPAATLIQELGGLISVHGHGKSSNFEGIRNHLAVKQALKTSYMREHIDIVEIGSPADAGSYHEKVFPTVGVVLPTIIGSDDHCRAAYPTGKFCWIKADPTFAGLMMALREPRTRFCLDEIPPDVDRVAKNKTKYIKSLSFSKLANMPRGEEWLQGEVPLNPGLVAVIGNKGAGKSAFADCIGLLGSCSTSDAFSFLEKRRFRHPRTGRAQYVQGTMKWHDGDPVTRTLNDDVSPTEPERVKYLPQNFVEKICNDLDSPGGGDFEKELKKVVFSKVPRESRLDKHSLDELVEFRTKELRTEAESLAQELQDLGERRERLEARLDPDVKTLLEKRIERKKAEIKSHNATKPPKKDPPATDQGASQEGAQRLARLESLNAEHGKVTAQIAAQESVIREQQLRAATAQKLLDKLDNLKKSFDRSIDDMFPEANALGLESAELATLTIDRDRVTSVQSDAVKARDVARAAIDGTGAEPPDGFKVIRDGIVREIKEIQEQLSRPQQEYQAYLEVLRRWTETLKKLEGAADDPESLAGLEAELKALDNVPAQVDALQTRQEQIAKEIHTLRVKEADVYTELYAPVQKFIANHPLATEQLKLTFKVEVVEEGFAENLLTHINQNLRGSFYGIDEGLRMAGSLAAPVDWSDWNKVAEFLRTLIDHLHHDKRPVREDTDVPLSARIKKGKTVAELYRWLYSLGYLKPRYLLRWDDKDVAQLSPGERGTLLLIFYLLVDDSDLPLIIDQPEANLDNITVAQKLVDCIRDARDRRQVIIVTHNPNLAVVCDADQIVYSTMDKPAGNRISYQTGALEHPDMNKFSIEVLEGGRMPFDKRDDTYVACGQ